MSPAEIFILFEKISVRKVEGKYSLYKPILLLFALSRCYSGTERFIQFSILNDALNEIVDKNFSYLKYHNFYYAFGRLENDGIWEIENSDSLNRSSSGDLNKSELLNKNIHGGFKKEIYDFLVSDRNLIKEVYMYLLNTYFEEYNHHYFLSLIGISNIKGRKMALISNEGEPVTGWWISKGIELIKTDRDIFSKPKMRVARQKFIAGANRLATIKGWMIAAQFIRNNKSAREYELTDFGLAISNNDPNLTKSSTWWSFHLSLCFSKESEPYPTFFCNLETITKDWVSWDQLHNKTKNLLSDEMGTQYKDSTVESLLSSVRRMFENDRPLAELGLIETRKIRDEGLLIRLGSPKITDEIIVHALAMIRFHRYKSRSTIDFSELSKDGLEHFLCCSSEQLRRHLRRMNQSHNWKRYFSFNEAVNIDSIAFEEDCAPGKTLLLLLQQGEDTWL